MKYGKIRAKTITQCVARLRAQFGDEAVIIRKKSIKLKRWYGLGIFGNERWEIEYGIPEGLAAKSRTGAARSPKKHSAPLPLKLEEKNDDRFQDIGLGKFSYSEDSRSTKNLKRIADRLKKSQMSASFVDSFLKKLVLSLSQEQRNEFSRVLDQSVQKLASLIRTSQIQLPSSEGLCRVIMLIGPSGMGKTVSLAKLASEYSLVQKRELSIYSLDQYRVAATQQLRTYAKILDVPFYAPLDSKEFADQLEKDGGEIIFIDTFAVGYRDQERFKVLAEFMDICESRVRLDRHLVIAANTQTNLIDKIYKAYDDYLCFERIILSKIDETEFIGAFVETADIFDRPFSYLMNGHQVPTDMRIANPKEMAEIVLGVKEMEQILG